MINKYSFIKINIINSSKYIIIIDLSMLLD